MKKIILLLLIMCITFNMNAQDIRCKAITKNGTQCRRKAVANGYCSQHYKMYYLDDYGTDKWLKEHPKKYFMFAVKLPEEWMAISQSPKLPDVMYAWYDKEHNTIYIYFKH